MPWMQRREEKGMAVLQPEGPGPKACRRKNWRVYGQKARPKGPTGGGRGGSPRAQWENPWA
eukprot:9839838-Lingulodinium_polyedra.AAC.1